MRYLSSLCLLCISVPALADTILSASIPLKAPRKKPPRQGGPLDKVELKMWIPNGIKVLRGAIVNPFYLKAVGQKHWQAAARHWGFGIVGANYFGVKSEDHDSLPAALKVFAQQSRRKEIEHIPFCFVGMSAGAGMSVKMAAEFPDRTLAVAPVCLEVGPRSEASYGIPMITIFGERDGRQMAKLRAKLPLERAKGAQWAIAPQWRRKHEFGQANNLAMVLFDQAIRQRYPKDADPRKGPVPLIKLSPKNGWLGDIESWTTNAPQIAPYKEYKKDPKQACWLLNGNVAAAWQAFVSHNPKVKLINPRGIGDGKPLQILKSDKPLSVKVAIPTETRLQSIALYAGQTKLAERKGSTDFPELTLKPGIHALYVIVTDKDGGKTISRPATVLVQP